MKGLFRLMVLLTAALALACCRGRFDGGSDSASDSFASHTVITGLDRQSPVPESNSPGDTLSGIDLKYVELSDFFTSVPIDSSVFARIDGRSYKEGCPVALEDLRYLRVLHKDLEGRTLVGEMIANQSIADDLLEIFRALYDAGYPIERMRLIDDYDADDETSMSANNTSCFNFRRKAHMNSVSKHAYGEAVDINPLYNPYYRVTPAGARIIEPASGKPYVDRAADFPYKIERGDLCHRLFLEHGFHWGGSWTRSKDYQHFER